MRRRLPTSLLALLLLPAAFAAEERTRVEYVLVDVVARDRGNRLVTDLTLDDFVVLDGGKKVVLESLDILDLRRNVLESEATPVVSELSYLPGPQDRPRRSQVLLVLDVPPEGSGAAMQAMRWTEDYLEQTEPLQGVEYRLHGIPAGPLMQGFSVDPAVVRQKLAIFRSDVKHAPVSRAGAGPTSEGLFLLEKRFCDCVGLWGVPLWNCIQEELHPYVREEIAHAEAVLQELGGTPALFTDPDAARTVILVSSGFSTMPGRAAVFLAGRYLPRSPPPRR